MSRKKSRKGGLIGIRKDADFKKNRVLPDQTANKGKGKGSGSRQQEHVAAAKKASGTAAKADPRLGSKKPIALVAAASAAASAAPVVAKPKPEKVAKPKVEALSPEQELERLENDTRLTTLIDRVDEGETLQAADQQWLDTQLARHRELLAELGLLEEDDDDLDGERSDDDLWDSLDASSLDDFKDS